MFKVYLLFWLVSLLKMLLQLPYFWTFLSIHFIYSIEFHLISALMLFISLDYANLFHFIKTKIKTSYMWNKKYKKSDSKIVLRDFDFIISGQASYQSIKQKERKKWIVEGSCLIWGPYGRICDQTVRCLHYTVVDDLFGIFCIRYTKFHLDNAQR